MTIWSDGEDMSKTKTTENDVERNLQSIFYIYQQDRVRFLLLKEQAKARIRKELNLTDDWIIELYGNQLKITTYKDYPIYVQNRICKCLEKHAKNISVATDYISKTVQITIELKRMEYVEGEYFDG